MKKKTTSSLIIVFVSFFIFLFSSCTSNWPQFRGPDANMVSESKKLPEQWANDTNVVWTYEIAGTGYSSPVTWGEKVFITAAYSNRKEELQTPMTPPPPPPPPPTGAGANPQRPAGQPVPPQGPPPEDLSYLKDTITCEVTCIDLKSGKELWKKVAYAGNPTMKKHRMNTYANETPVTDGNRLYVYFGMIGVFCYDLSGNLLWKTNLGAYETLNGWGTGASPVLFKDLLFVKVDNDTTSFITALDAASGKEVWKMAREEKTTYSTPVIWKNMVRTELVTTGKTTRSYDPATGKLLWELKMAGEMSISSPVYNQEYIFLGNAGGREKPGALYCIRAGAEGDISPSEGETTSSGVVWTSVESGIANPSPLLLDDKLYVLASRGGELACVDAATGKNLYKQKVEKTGACWASPWAANGKVLFYDEKGITHIIKAGPVFEELGQNQLDDKFWSSPAIAGDAYVFRGQKKLFCVKKAG